MNIESHVINRPDRRGWSLGLLAKATLKTKLLDSGQTRSFEYGVWEVKCKNTVTMVTGIYHPPYSVHNPVTLTLFILYSAPFIIIAEVLHNNIVFYTYIVH